jgi:hypothetical protein
VPDRRGDRHAVYGLAIQSELALTLPHDATGAPAQITIAHGSPESFAAFSADAAPDDPSDWYRCRWQSDGSTYVRWQGVGEFLVSPDGSFISCRRFAEASDESFQVYLVQRALSFALVKRGLEPLHATAVVVDGRAIAFLGHGGFGKSSLAAAFLRAGHRLLTDDLLLVERLDSGCCGHPGPARLKLFPRVARRMLGAGAAGVPMNPDTKKLVMPLKQSQTWQAPAPLAAFYVLPAPGSKIRHIAVDEMEPRLAFLEIVRHTFNHVDRNPDRLRRQFVAAWQASCDVPVKRLSYPRRLDALGDLRRAILADIETH